ncbi:MAG: 2'-5' RNA ligase family protein [Phenylobacterium sp.]
MASDEHRVYFALQPDPAAARAAFALAQAVRREHGLTAPVMPVARMHVSLLRLADDHTGQTIDKAREAVARIAQPPFRIAFNRLASFGGDALVLYGDEGVIGAELLHAAIHAALKAPGIAHGRPRAIAPHMTLMRQAPVLPEAHVAPVSWVAREFVLVHSTDGRHDVLGRWPLVSPPA